jgi:hypothetical protein
MLPSNSASWIHFRMSSQSIRNRYLYFSFFPFDALVSLIFFLQNLVYTGTRGGIIARWDTRTSSQHKQFPLFSNRYNSSSITKLCTIGQHGLLVNSMDGRLELFDLRFPLHSTPITSFPGHVNSYNQTPVSSEMGKRPEAFTDECRTLSR